MSKIKIFDVDVNFIKFPISYQGLDDYVKIPRCIVPFMEVKGHGDKDNKGNDRISSIGYSEENNLIGVTLIEKLKLKDITVENNRVVWLYPAEKQQFDNLVKSPNKYKYFNLLRRQLMSVSEPCESYKFVA